MAIDVSTLEPAERDPAKLRKTAFTILIVALLGGLIVVWAYRLKTKAEEDRPAIVTRLESNFGAINQDGVGIDIGQLEGEVWLATTIALSQPEVSADAISAMLEIANEYPKEKVAKFVCLTIDPKNDTTEM